jgi:hypothetical protein
MRDFWRLAATVMIWGFLTMVMVFTITSSTGPIANADGGQVTAIITVLAIAASIGTAAIWTGGRGEERRADTTNIARGKNKRTGRDRIERLIQSLDEDEIYDLESLLLAREEDSAHRQKQP